MIKNPVSAGLAHVSKQFSELEFNPSGFVPSVLTAFVLLIILLLFIVLWPYGIVAIMEDLVRGLMHKARVDMKDIAIVARMPFAVALGVYFLVWLPFAILCLPIVVLGGIGSLFSK